MFRLFTDKWNFQLCEKGNTYQSVLEINNWHKVELPHDWLIYDKDNYYRDGEGWYTKSFIVSPAELGKAAIVVFDGVYMNSTVYVNGQEVGEWKNGYTSFWFDISQYLVVGENRIAVRVDYTSPNTRWYSGAGIYRNVWFGIKEKTHILPEGIYVSTKKEDDTYRISVETQYVGEVDNIRYTIFDIYGKAMSVFESNKEIAQFSVVKPVTWDIKHPYLHTLKVELIKDNNTVDEETTTFGFRSVKFSVDEGVVINNRRVKLKGVCLHHDLGALGSAMNKKALKRQLKYMKDMGVNAIRTTHNAPSRELLSLCDEMGFLVIDEGFDMWEIPKTKNDYSLYFKEWWQKDVKAWITRDRNHPCVIMWSIGNEITETSNNEKGIEIARKLKAEVEKYDPCKNAVVTIGSNYMSGQTSVEIADELKFAGYNYSEYLYDAHHMMFHDWFIYGSETASTVRSRGIYHFPIGTGILKYPDRQCSDLGNSVVDWGSNNEAALVYDRDRLYSGGQFIWTGIDYIGEPTPYTTKNSYFGAMDTACFPKSAFYLYKAMWNENAEPFVKLFPYWDWNVGEEIDVIAYSNVSRLELFLNNVSLGEQTIDLQNGKVLHAHWKVKYLPGELVIKAYDKSKNVIATDRQVSFGDAMRISLDYKKKPIFADGRDLKFISVSVVDTDGNVVENATNRISVSVNGRTRLVGLDNGDSTDTDSYKGNSKRLFSGKLLAIFQAGTAMGDTEVTFSSVGLEPVTIRITALPCDTPVGVSVPRDRVYGMHPAVANDELPLRKIELNASRTELSEKHPTADITYTLHPAGASYDDVSWKCLTLSGEKCDNATIFAIENGVQIMAVRDGEFKIVACSKNGKAHTSLTSELVFAASGISPQKQLQATDRLLVSTIRTIRSDGFKTARTGIWDMAMHTTLDVGEVDFGAEGVSRLVMFGKSRGNAIIIKTRDSYSGEEKKQGVFLPQAEEMQEITVEIDTISGLHHLMILPTMAEGLAIQWFRFE